MQDSGAVVRADVMEGPDKRSKGTGTVLFETPAEAHTAMCMYPVSKGDVKPSGGQEGVRRPAAVVSWSRGVWMGRLRLMLVNGNGG